MPHTHCNRINILNHVYERIQRLLTKCADKLVSIALDKCVYGNTKMLDDPGFGRFLHISRLFVSYLSISIMLYECISHAPFLFLSGLGKQSI